MDVEKFLKKPETPYFIGVAIVSAILCQFIFGYGALIAGLFGVAGFAAGVWYGKN